MKKVLSISILIALASFNANANNNEKKLDYSGVVSAGAYYNDGTTSSQQYNLDAQGTIKDDLWVHGAGLSYFRSKEGKNLSGSNLTAKYNVDRFIYNDIFWDAFAEYKYDWVENIKSKTTIGTGIGYKAFENEYGLLSLTGSLGFQNIKYRKEGAKDANHALVKLDWNYNVDLANKAVKLYSNGNIGRSLNNNVKLDTTITVGAAYRLSEWLSLNTGITKSITKTKEANTNTTKYTLGVSASF